MIFEDRWDAGRRLADAVVRRGIPGDVVVALPRGGVPVGWEVARVLGVPLDILAVRKLGAPGRPELAIGAVVDGGEPFARVDLDMVRRLGVPPAYLDGEIARQTELLRRGEAVFRAGRPPERRTGRRLILVDDGLATGATVRAALERLRRDGPAGLALAVPVGAADTVASLQGSVDALVCLHAPLDFEAVGQYYREFDSVPDEDVLRCLTRSSV